MEFDAVSDLDGKELAALGERIRQAR